MIALLGRLFRLFLGFLALPLCVAATMAVIEVARMLQPASAASVPPGVWAMAVGFACWLGLFFVMPRPVRSYVLAHELTHALWAYMTGGSVESLRVGKTGGSVVVRENNILVTLAPYFFPLYTVLTICAYGVLSIFRDVSRYEWLWLAAVGFTWSYHVTFTVSTILQHQSDLRHYGRLLSATLIYLLNVLGVGLWIVAVSRVTLEQFVGELGTAGRSLMRVIVAVSGQ